MAKSDQTDEKVTAQLATLSAEVEAAGLGPADLSYDSIDRVETWYGRVLAKQVKTSIATDDLATHVATYAGEVLRRKTGAKWGEETRDGATLAVVRSLPELKSYKLAPIRAVLLFRDGRKPGTIRDGIEPYDVPRRREQLAAEVKNAAAEVEALRAGVEALGRAELLPLDFSKESLDRLQAALKLSLERNPTPAIRRVLQRRAALYVGECLRRAKPDATWTLNEDPKDLAFGYGQIRGRTPQTTIANHRPARDAPTAFKDFFSKFL